MLTNLGNIYVFGQCMFAMCGGDHEHGKVLSVPTRLSLNLSIKRVFVGMNGLFLEDY